MTDKATEVVARALYGMKNWDEPDDKWKDEIPEAQRAIAEMRSAGYVVVPDNDYAFMARYTALPPERKKVIREFAEAMIDSAKD